MRIVSTSILFGILLFAVIGCGLVDRFTGGQDMTKVGSLWPDVPKMDGFAPNDMDMPAWTKLVLRTIIGNMGKLNKEGEDRSTGNIDWIAYTTSASSADIKNFYTDEKMASAGQWKTGKDAPCIDGKDKGVDGIICIFQKEDASRQTSLVMLAAADEKTKKTNVFFVRLEGENTKSNPANK